MPTSKPLPRIQTPKETFTVDYPEAVDFADKQAAVFWPHFEVKVQKDKQDILVNMTPAERHATVTTLKLFTKYEQIIGDEFWLNFVFKKFPRSADIQPMAAMFAAMELQVHAKFYSKINEELGLATDEFYNEYTADPVLSDRIVHLRSLLSGKDDLRALGGFTFGEGAVLYSNFVSWNTSKVKARTRLWTSSVVSTSHHATRIYTQKQQHGSSVHWRKNWLNLVSLLLKMKHR